ncbi:unnamed protein product [Caenorhabditis sp. 36 PRJEB53466]|nr:unnamed protein product [Caenorhabditis sp. 36 PRJEB53466]
MIVADQVSRLKRAVLHSDMRTFNQLVNRNSDHQFLQNVFRMRSLTVLSGVHSHGYHLEAILRADNKFFTMQLGLDSRSPTGYVINAAEEAMSEAARRFSKD